MLQRYESIRYDSDVAQEQIATNQTAFFTYFSMEFCRGVDFQLPPTVGLVTVAHQLTFEEFAQAATRLRRLHSDQSFITAVQHDSLRHLKGTLSDGDLTWVMLVPMFQANSQRRHARERLLGRMEDLDDVVRERSFVELVYNDSIDAVRVNRLLAPNIKSVTIDPYANYRQHHVVFSNSVPRSAPIGQRIADHRDRLVSRYGDLINADDVKRLSWLVKETHRSTHVSSGNDQMLLPTNELDLDAAVSVHADIKQNLQIQRQVDGDDDQLLKAAVEKRWWRGAGRQWTPQTLWRRLPRVTLRTLYDVPLVSSRLFVSRNFAKTTTHFTGGWDKRLKQPSVALLRFAGTEHSICLISLAEANALYEIFLRHPSNFFPRDNEALLLVPVFNYRVPLTIRIEKAMFPKWKKRFSSALHRKMLQVWLFSGVTLFSDSDVSVIRTFWTPAWESFIKQVLEVRMLTHQWTGSSLEKLIAVDRVTSTMEQSDRGSDAADSDAGGDGHPTVDDEQAEADAASRTVPWPYDDPE